MTASGGLQTARTLEPGQWEVTAGSTVPVSTRFVEEIADLVDQAADELDDGDPVTPEEERRAIVSALGVVLFQPAPILAMQVRRGVANDVDLGVRWAGPALRVDGKWRFTHTDDLDLAFDVGLTHHTGIGASAASSAFDLFDSLHLVSYSRKDLDANVIISNGSNRRVQSYGALRYTAAFIDVETELDDALEAADEAGIRDTSSTLHAFGASAGLRLGTPRIALLLELTVLRILFEPEILDAPANLSGYLIEPAAAISVTF